MAEHFCGLSSLPDRVTQTLIPESWKPWSSCPSQAMAKAFAVTFRQETNHVTWVPSVCSRLHYVTAALT